MLSRWFILCAPAAKLLWSQMCLYIRFLYVFSAGPRLSTTQLRYSWVCDRLAAELTAASAMRFFSEDSAIFFLFPFPNLVSRTWFDLYLLCAVALLTLSHLIVISSHRLFQLSLISLRLWVIVHSLFLYLLSVILSISWRLSFKSPYTSGIKLECTVAVYSWSPAGWICTVAFTALSVVLEAFYSECSLLGSL